MSSKRRRSRSMRLIMRVLLCSPARGRAPGAVCIAGAAAGAWGAPSPVSRPPVAAAGALPRPRLAARGEGSDSLRLGSGRPLGAAETRSHPPPPRPHPTPVAARAPDSGAPRASRPRLRHRGGPAPRGRPAAPEGPPARAMLGRNPHRRLRAAGPPPRTGCARLDRGRLPRTRALRLHIARAKMPPRVQRPSRRLAVPVPDQPRAHDVIFSCASLSDARDQAVSLIDPSGPRTASAPAPSAAARSCRSGTSVHQRADNS